MTESSSSALLSLPDELIAHIFSRVDEPHYPCKIRLSCLLLSRRLFRILQPIAYETIQTHVRQDYVGQRRVAPADLTRIGPNAALLVRALTTKIDGESYLHSLTIIGERFMHLRQLEIDCNASGPRLSVEGATEMYQAYRRLLARVPHLTHLAIRGPVRFPSVPELARQAAQVASLRHLEMYSHVEDPDFDLALIPPIESLRLFGYSDHSVQLPWQSLQRLHLTTYGWAALLSQAVAHSLTTETQAGRAIALKSLTLEWQAPVFSTPTAVAKSAQALLECLGPARELSELVICTPSMGNFDAPGTGYPASRLLSTTRCSRSTIHSFLDTFPNLTRLRLTKPDAFIRAFENSAAEEVLGRLAGDVPEAWPAFLEKVDRTTKVEELVLEGWPSPDRSMVWCRRSSEEGFRTEMRVIL
ncbi:hypothetical protein BMF94_3789 [Rhodotorula taiwanensis]|uniref:F-box domain-containing protein n=1 Tax=Rhodotorula taiwanensis TaxID=741276 RepID=A0A2S5B8S2_9BASI|nr:hypothetical protein BMF94_3789 [Rhodotorula taiwanensis]